MLDLQTIVYRGGIQLVSGHLQEHQNALGFAREVSGRGLVGVNNLRNIILPRPWRTGTRVRLLYQALVDDLVRSNGFWPQSRLNDRAISPSLRCCRTD
jgi:hypothetical protein